MARQVHKNPMIVYSSLDKNQENKNKGCCYMITYKSGSKNKRTGVVFKWGQVIRLESHKEMEKKFIFKPNIVAINYSIA